MKRILNGDLPAIGLIAVVGVIAAVLGSWELAIFCTFYVVLLLLKVRFFPSSRKPLHPPSESTLQFLRKRRAKAR